MAGGFDSGFDSGFDIAASGGGISLTLNRPSLTPKYVVKTITVTGADVTFDVLIEDGD